MIKECNNLKLTIMLIDEKEINEIKESVKEVTTRIDNISDRCIKAFSERQATEKTKDNVIKILCELQLMLIDLARIDIILEDEKIEINFENEEEKARLIPVMLNDLEEKFVNLNELE